MSRVYIHEPAHIGEHIADTITTFVGSWLFIGLHALWFTAWIVFRVEPFPYGLLTMIVSLEAIFLSTLVMISQNRQAGKDRLRDDHEALTVDTMAEDHKLLMQMNEQQLTILDQQTAILQLLQGSNPIREVAE